MQLSLQRLQETTAQAHARLEEELEARRQHIGLLEAKLERQKDYDELKREALAATAGAPRAEPEPARSLEQLLLERTKALQHAEALKRPSTPEALGKSLHQLNVSSAHYSQLRHLEGHRWMCAGASMLTPARRCRCVDAASLLARLSLSLSLFLRAVSGCAT